MIFSTPMASVTCLRRLYALHDAHTSATSRTHMSLNMPCCTNGLHACRILRSIGTPARSDWDCQVVGWRAYNLAQSQRGSSAASQHSTANSTRELQLYSEECVMQLHAGQAEEEKCHKSRPVSILSWRFAHRHSSIQCAILHTTSCCALVPGPA